MGSQGVNVTGAFCWKAVVPCPPFIGLSGIFSLAKLGYNFVSESKAVKNP